MNCCNLLNFLKICMLNIRFGVKAGAVSRYCSGSTKMMRLRLRNTGLLHLSAAPALLGCTLEHCLGASAVCTMHN
jgi:hypothetical protein